MSETYRHQCAVVVARAGDVTIHVDGRVGNSWADLETKACELLRSMGERGPVAFRRCMVRADIPAPVFIVPHEVAGEAEDVTP